MRAKLFQLTLVLTFCGCTEQGLPDGGRNDGSVLIDGGGLSIGGCTSPTGDKFIAILETTAPDPPFLCALLSFRRFDGGFTPIMPGFVAPEGYAMDDARYSNGCDIELPSGQLSSVNTAPVTGAWGSAEFVFVLGGRPQSFQIDGGVVLGSRVFEFSRFAGCNSTCVGN